MLLAIWIDETLVGFLPSVTQHADHFRDAGLARFWGSPWLISLLTGIIFGLVAGHAGDPSATWRRTLKDEAGAITSTASIGLRKSLVVAQVTLSLLLLVGAGLFIRSLKNLKGLDPGFKTRNLLTFAIDAPSQRL